jgi:hypothetical protein
MKRGPPEQIIVLPLLPQNENKLSFQNFVVLKKIQKMHDCRECQKHQSNSLQYTIIRILYGQVKVILCVSNVRQFQKVIQNFRKASQHSLTKLQNEGQVTIRTLHATLEYRFHFCMNKWTLSYGEGWEQIIKLYRICLYFISAYGFKPHVYQLNTYLMTGTKSSTYINTF